MSEYKLTQAEEQMAVRVGMRAASMVNAKQPETQERSMLDALSTQMEASGVSPGELGYRAIGQKAFQVLLANISVRHDIQKKGDGDRRGWNEYLSGGQANCLPPPDKGHREPTLGDLGISIVELSEEDRNGAETKNG